MATRRLPERNNQAAVPHSSRLVDMSGGVQTERAMRSRFKSIGMGLGAGVLVGVILGAAVGGWVVWLAAGIAFGVLFMAAAQRVSSSVVDRG